MPYIFQNNYKYLCGKNTSSVGEFGKTAGFVINGTWET